MRARNNAPVIIKRKKSAAAAGHHGGAWKVAYADFVTAMMAFFLLMWLLNATTEKQRKGIADYFNPTIPVNRISGGGDGAFGGDNIFAEQVLAQSGTGGTRKSTTAYRQSRGRTGTDTSPGRREAGGDEPSLESVEKALLERAGESRLGDETLAHIITRVTDEGLVAELFDRPGAPLFTPGTDTPRPITRRLAGLIAEVFGLVTNSVAIEAHVRARPVVLAHDPGWQLSSDRAQAGRRLLAGAGLAGARVVRVTGHGARRPAARDPMAPRNNRLVFILLRNDG